MKDIKKIITLAIVICMSMAMLAACGGFGSVTPELLESLYTQAAG